jgi:hypothetical protein
MMPVLRSAQSGSFFGNELDVMGNVPSDVAEERFQGNRGDVEQASCLFYVQRKAARFSAMNWT